MTTPTTLISAQGVFTPDWAILATEAAAALFVFALIIVIFGWLGRRKRIKAAHALLDERDALAESATETFHNHVQALEKDRTLTPDELDDYEQRSLQIINELVEPWLEPSAVNLREAVREIMTIRHNDLHQIAAIFRQPHSADTTTNEAAIAPQVMQLQTELAASQKAEAERSAQLAEALKSVSIIVGEYGRKFGVEADYRVPQILRALIYLQAMDKGMNQEQAVQAADASMDVGIDVIEENVIPADEPQVTAPQPVQTSSEAKAEVSAKPSPIAEVEQAAKAIPNEDIEAIFAEIDSTKVADIPAPKAVEKQTPKAEEKPVPAAPNVAEKPQEPAKPAVGEKPNEAAKPAAVEKQKEQPAAAPVAAKEEAHKPAEPMPASAEEKPTKEEPTKEETMDEESTDDEVLIDLDAVELPEKAPEVSDFNLDLDDIDALLDAEIARQQAKTETPAPHLPNLDDDDLDLSKKP